MVPEEIFVTLFFLLRYFSDFVGNVTIANKLTVSSQSPGFPGACHGLYAKSPQKHPRFCPAPAMRPLLLQELILSPCRGSSTPQQRCCTRVESL